jgi:PAS domain S-box-containing protein
MANARVNNPPASASAFRPAVTFLKWLVEPLARVDEKQRRHLKLLSAFLLLMAANTFIGALAMGGEDALQMVMLLTGSILAFGYVLSRTRCHGVSTGIAVSIPAVPIVAMVLFRPDWGHIATQLPWLALPLLICSLLLTLRRTIIVATVYVLAIIGLTFSMRYPVPNSAESLAYIIMIMFFVVAVAAARRGDQREIERQLHEREQAEEALRESEEKFSSAFKTSPNAICIVSIADGNFIESNEGFSRFIGYPAEEVIGRSPVELALFVNEDELNRMATELQEKGRVYNQELQSRRKSGEIRQGLFSAEVINIGGKPCVIFSITDITERKRAEQLQEDENHILTLLSQDVELKDLLNAILRMGELRDPSTKGSVLLVDPAKGILVQAAGPNLPPDFKQLLADGLPIGEGVGSCGTAAYRKERVIIPDIGKSPSFQDDVVTITRRNNILSCWSQPIISSQGELLGTIANYASRVGRPDARNLAILEWSARIAAIAIERRRAEQALKESEEKFSKAFYASPHSMVITTLKDGRFIEVNDSHAIFSGYSRKEIIGRTAADLKTWARQEDRDRILKMLKEKGRVNNEEIQFRRKSGEIRIVLFAAEIINIGGEECLISITTDITQRKQAEEALKESEQKFSVAFRSSPDAIAITTLKDGEFIEVNDSYTRITGYTREEVIGHSSAEFGVWAKAEERNKILRTLKEHGRVINEEVHLHKKSGEVTISLFSADIINIGGEPCMISVATDITERKQAEEKLKEAMSGLEKSSAQLEATNRELETFSYSVSHDLRTPLRSIDGFSQALLEDHSDRLDEQGKDYLNRLRLASQKMGALIDGLLKLSRLTRSEMHQETVDLGAMAQEIAREIQETQPDHKVEFTTVSGLTARGDPQLLRVLLENLIGNAWKFSLHNPHARIEFGNERTNGKTEFFVRDNGVGFDMAYASKLFGAFQRLHSAEEFPGTGIGLATVQRIINRHGGTIRAEGAVGKGATFYFTLG